MTATVATLPLRPLTLLLLRRSDEMLPAMLLYHILETQFVVRRFSSQFYRRMLSSESPIAEFVSAFGLLAAGAAFVSGYPDHIITHVFPMWFWAAGMLVNGIGQAVGVVSDFTPFRRLFGLGAISVYSMMVVVMTLETVPAKSLVLACLLALLLCSTLAWAANLRNAR